MTIKQGDAYWVPIDIELDGSVPAEELFREIEITVGRDVHKTGSEGDVAYLEGQWYFWLSQLDTLNLEPGMHIVELRVKFNNDPDADVVTVEAGMVEVRTSNHGKEI